MRFDIFVVPPFWRYLECAGFGLESFFVGSTLELGSQMWRVNLVRCGGLAVFALLHLEGLSWRQTAWFGLHFVKSMLRSFLSCGGI